jgi:hypothetical protein
VLKVIDFLLVVSGSRAAGVGSRFGAATDDAVEPQQRD